MGFSSQGGRLVLRTQTVQGTYQADTGTAGAILKTRSGTLGPSRDLLVPDPEAGSGRDVADAYLGAVSWAGDIEFYARSNSLITLLYAALGSKSLNTVTGVTTHTLTPTDAAQLPFLSVEEKIGASMEVFQYTDVVVNTLHLESDANGYLMGTVGLIAAKQTSGNTPGATPVEDATPMYVGTNIAITYNAVTLPAKSFSIDINNNFEDDDFRLGSFYIGDLSPKRREMTVTFHIREASSALWKQAVYGINSATAPGGVTTKQQLVVTAQTYENIPASTPPTPYTISVTIPKFVLSPYALSVSGDDIIEDDLDGQALRPSTGTPLTTILVKTDLTVVA